MGEEGIGSTRVTAGGALQRVVRSVRLPEVVGSGRVAHPNLFDSKLRRVIAWDALAACGEEVRYGDAGVVSLTGVS